MSIQQMFLGAALRRVLITDRTITHTAPVASTGRAGIQMNGSGALNETRTISDVPTAVLGQWMLLGTGTDYEKRATIISGPTTGGTSGGTFGSWLNGASTHTWYVEKTTAIVSQLVVQLEIRDASTLAVLSTALFTLEANTL